MFVFCKNAQPLSLGCYFGRHTAFFRTLCLVLWVAQTLLPKCAYRPWDHFRFWVKTDQTRYDTSRILGWVGFAFFVILFLCLKNLSQISFPPLAPLPPLAPSTVYKQALYISRLAVSPCMKACIYAGMHAHMQGHMQELFVAPVQCSEAPLGARHLQRLGPL